MQKLCLELNNMIKIDQVIIVEGRNDLSLLKSLVDAEIVTTGGTSMNQDFWNLLSLYNRSGKEFIVMVDPDSQGERIRLAISKVYPKAKHIFIQASDARSKNKVGVEHASKKVIIDSLKNIKSFDKGDNKITYLDLTSLGLTGQVDSNNLRLQLTNKLGIGYCNAKTLLNRLNGIGLELDLLKKTVEELKK
jgi:ribonuclease M5